MCFAHIDKHSGTIPVILARHWLWLPDDGSCVNRNMSEQILYFECVFNNPTIHIIEYISWIMKYLLLLMHGVTMKMNNCNLIMIILFPWMNWNHNVDIKHTFFKYRTEMSLRRYDPITRVCVLILLVALSRFKEIRNYLTQCTTNFVWCLKLPLLH